MVLFGYGIFVTGSLTFPGKIPCRMAAVGTVAICGAAFTSRDLCQAPKKNVRFLTMGPPSVAPNWFWMNSALPMG